MTTNLRSSGLLKSSVCCYLSVRSSAPVDSEQLSKWYHTLESDGNSWNNANPKQNNPKTKVIALQEWGSMRADLNIHTFLRDLCPCTPILQSIMPRMTSNNDRGHHQARCLLPPPLEQPRSYTCSHSVPYLARTPIPLVVQVNVDWIREITTVVLSRFLSQSILGDDLKGLFDIDTLLGAGLEIRHLATALAVCKGPLGCNHPPVFA